jgi:hypothetical protein
VTIPLLKGRRLRDSDREVVVNHALAQKHFQNEDPRGHRIVFGEAGDWLIIVGVVSDVKTSGLASAPEPATYYSYRHATPSSDVGLILRSPLAAGTIASELRRMVAEIDVNQPAATIEAMNERLSTSVSGPRFAAALLAAFASLALLLGILGVYGVMACRVQFATSRTGRSPSAGSGSCRRDSAGVAPGPQRYPARGDARLGRSARRQPLHCEPAVWREGQRPTHIGPRRGSACGCCIGGLLHASHTSCSRRSHGRAAIRIGNSHTLAATKTTRAGLEREFRSDLELEAQEQRENGL